MQAENKQTVGSTSLSSRLQYACQINGNVKVLAIRDPLAAKSACSMCINVGSYYEPKQIPGLSHLLEHMLLMGSSSYPQSNSFSTFISSHHSYQNAQTNDFSTTYFFEAISRACDALINPLFPEQIIQAEIEAVNEEYILAGDEDQSRIQQIIRGFRNEEFGRFVMGRKQELGVKGIRNQLIKFHCNFYRKAEVCFVVYSSVSTQEMQKNIMSQILKIGCIQTQLLQTLKIEQMLKQRAYNSESPPKLVTIKSLNNQDTLTLHIPIQLTTSPHFSPSYSTSEINELNYQFFEALKYIICHSSDYSLLSYLEEQDIGNSLQIDMDIVVPSHTYAINIVIGLQQEAIQKVVYICQKIMQYFSNFINWDVLLVAHCEVAELAMLSFVNNEVQDLEDFICEISNDILQFGIPSAISYKNMQNNRILQFKELCIWCIEQLTKGSNRIAVLSTPDNLKGQTKVEPYFNIPFIVTDLPLKLSSQKNSPVKPLPKNPFLPFSNRINKFPTAESSQKFIQLSPRIHYSQIQSQIEKGGIKILFHNTESYTFNILFVQFMDLVIQQVQNIGYAESIGLNTFFQFRNGWLYFEIFGYLHLVMIIIDQVGEKLGWLVKEIQSGSAKESEEIQDMFIMAIQNVEEQIDNYYEEQMDDLTDKILDQLLIKDSLPLHLMDKQLQKIKKNKFLQRCANILKTSLLQWIVVGNFPQQQILKISAKFENKMSNFTETNFQYKQTKVMNLAPQKKSNKLEVRLQSPSVRTSTCLAYFQGGCYNRKMYWILQIISLFLEEPFYRYVRLMKKLSYDLEVNLVNTRGVLGICFLLVSSKIDPELISKQIHSFLSTHLQPTRLSSDLSKNLDKLKQSILLNSSAQFATIEQHFDFICDQIQTRSYYWDKKTKQQIQRQLQRIKVADVIQITNRIFKNSLQILIVSKGHKQQYGDHRPKIGSIEKIKQKGEYYKDLINDVNFRFDESM